MKNVRMKIYLDKGFLFSWTTHKLAVETSHWCQKSHPQSSLLIFTGASQGGFASYFCSLSPTFPAIVYLFTQMFHRQQIWS